MAVITLRKAICIRVLRLFKRQGLLDPDVIDNLKAWGYGGGFSVAAVSQQRLTSNAHGVAVSSVSLASCISG
ncbi:MAG TPA: hypothetical protein ENJ65_00945 [Candidatus Tenderia electrophaga]|uniref:Uncharacterized protein n=1 Tax=Candidatus Tenderia electrophaga TaxID=1748243 RepID=A0A832N4Q8_9GAMM|nr:hypothetical protein [Candidatus Tenderia electrophaga]